VGRRAAFGRGDEAAVGKEGIMPFGVEARADADGPAEPYADGSSQMIGRLWRGEDGAWGLKIDRIGEPDDFGAYPEVEIDAAPTVIGFPPVVERTGNTLSWQPSVIALLIPMVVVLGLLLWLDRGRHSWLGWAVTFWWCLPVGGSVVGICGMLAARRRISAYGRLWDSRVVLASRDTLLVVVPTIGRPDTFPALQRVVRSYCAHLPGYFADVRVDIVTEEGCGAEQEIEELARHFRGVRVLTVPAGYHTPGGTRFKARANHYAHEIRIAEGEARDDVWVLHMDDDTAVATDTAVALARFIEQQRYNERRDAHKHLAQGILTYPRENARSVWSWLADAARPAADLAQFSVFTGNGTPLAGLHGELLLVRASIEAEIGWDFGPKAIVEDAQWALIFSQRYPGRAGWYNGRSYGASPATLRDFVKQRDRWAWGLIGLAMNRSIPLRDRLMILYSISAWLLSPLQHVGVVLLVGAATGTLDTAPVTAIVLPIWALNVAYAVWTYWEGLKVNRYASRDTRRRPWEMVAVIALIPVFSLLEACGAVRGLWRCVKREENRFVVIAKPA
jgi:egghead protein (zeste-white 4 protein)